MVLLFGILLFSVVIFFLLPRATGGYLSGFAAKDQLWPRVSMKKLPLGAIGTIQQSNDVVMHVQFAANSTPPLDMKWRGMALALFDGRRWSNPRDPRNQARQVLPSSPGSGFKIQRHSERRASLEATAVSYRVIMEPTATRFVFLCCPRSPTSREITDFSRSASGMRSTISPSRAADRHVLGNIDELSGSRPGTAARDW